MQSAVSGHSTLSLYSTVPPPGAAEHYRGSPGARRHASRAKGYCRRLLEASTTGTDAAMLATVTLPSTPVFV